MASSKDSAHKTPHSAPEHFRILSSFFSNINALRVFSEMVGQRASALDKETMRTYHAALESAMQLQFPKHAETAEGGTQRSDAQAVPDDDKTLAKKIQKSLTDPTNLRRVLEANKQLSRKPPVQAEILQQSVIISTIIFFEQLVSDLVRFYFKRFPAAIPSETKLLSLQELKGLGSLEAAEDHIIEKECDALLRQDLDGQMKFFQDRLKVSLESLCPSRDDLVEICQRRNLIVHNGSIVNRYYITNVDQALRTRHKAIQGKHLDLSLEYVASSLDVTLLSGLCLAASSFRRWDKKTTETIDDLCFEECYQALKEKRHGLALSIAREGRKQTNLSDLHQRLFCINQAIAQRHLGQRQAMSDTLASMDWSAANRRFRVAIDVLNSREKEAAEGIRDCLKGGDITPDDLSEWPLFESARRKAWFENLRTQASKKLREKQLKSGKRSRPSGLRANAQKRNTVPEPSPDAQALFDKNKPS